MRKLAYLLLLSLLGCSGLKYGTLPKNLTVTHIQKIGLKTEVYARKSYMIWLGVFDTLPDSVKVGSILTAYPSNVDSCTCIFKRIK